MRRSLLVSSNTCFMPDAAERKKRHQHNDALVWREGRCRMQGALGARGIGREVLGGSLGLPVWCHQQRVPWEQPDCDEVTQESQEQLRAVPATAVSSPHPCCRHPGGCSPTGTSPSRSARRRKVMSSFGGRRGEEGVRQGRGSRKEREGTQGKPRTELFLGEQPGRCGAVQTQTQGEFRSSDRGGEAGCYNGTRTPGTAPHHASCTGAADVIPQ